MLRNNMEFNVDIQGNNMEFNVDMPKIVDIQGLVFSYWKQQFANKTLLAKNRIKMNVNKLYNLFCKLACLDIN